ncbi:MAG: hypothetical protein LAN64_00820 [Acidobacteriia bacterium]|nr:hypothetical protein [Terriglobia bacterium]
MISAVARSALDVSYKQKRTALEIVADIAAGWSRGAKTYEYAEHTAMDFPCDHLIKVEMAVVPLPRGFQNDARKFPRDQESGGGDEHIGYVLRGSLLTVTVQLLNVSGRLNPALEWRLTDTGKVALEWFRSPIARRGSTSFELRLRLVIHPPLHATAEDLRVWHRRYLPDVPSVAFLSALPRDR